MTNEKLWNRYCQYLRIYPEVGLSLDISRVRFGDGFFEQMSPKMSAAFKQMSELESGAIANPDEQRMVGHYWLRTPEKAPTGEIRSTITDTLEDIKQFAKDIHRGTIHPQGHVKFENLVVVGIGGSALGPQLVYDSLTGLTSPMRVLFVDNTDPDGIARIAASIEQTLAKTLVIVISKSGGTVETRNGALELAAVFSKAGLSFSEHAIAITCPGSKLDSQALEEQWLKRFPMWDWVGGRTSLFSAVGLVPAALHGIDIDSFLGGARKMDELTRNPEMLQNPAALLALMWYQVGDGRGKKDMVILPYKDRLMLMSKYLQQLVMESLGKEKNLRGEVVHQGIAVYGNKGSTDQHAYVQQLRDGVNNFFATFIEVLSDFAQPTGGHKSLEVEPNVTSGDYLSGFFQGTRRALYENERDSITITLDSLSAFSVGALIALYERAVGLYASLVDINAYHQPGVEAGKKAAARVIEMQKKLVSELGKKSSTPLTAQELANQIGAPDEAETAYKILEHLAANPERKVKRHGDRHPLKAKYQLG